MTSRTPKIAQARATVPNLAVFSRRCGVSATKDAGIATLRLGPFTAEVIFSLWRGGTVWKMNLIALDCILSWWPA